MIRIMHHLARSGGTLVSKCLGSMADIVLLSEVNPQHALIAPEFSQLLAKHDPIYQGLNWFGLLDRDDATAIAAAPAFRDKIRLLSARCESQERHLLLRDWSHLDFVGQPFLKACQYQFTCADLLRGDGEIRQLALVRHPADQWFSLSKLQLLQDLTPADFLYGYRRFGECCRDMAVLRYEDFCRVPDETLEIACAVLQLPFDGGYRSRWADYRTITGDNSQARHIQPAPRPYLDPALVEVLQKNPDYQEICASFGYAPALPSLQISAAS